MNSLVFLAKASNNQTQGGMSNGLVSIIMLVLQEIYDIDPKYIFWLLDHRTSKEENKKL